MRRSRWLIVLGVLGVACGSGPSVSPKAHLAPYCAVRAWPTPPGFVWPGPLSVDTPERSVQGLYLYPAGHAKLNDALVDWDLSPLVVVRASGPHEVDGQTVQPADLAKALRQAKALREAPPARAEEIKVLRQGTTPSLTVLADARAPSASVAAVLAAGAQAEMGFARLLVPSARPNPVLTAPDPQRAAAMRQELLKTTPDRRAMIGALAMDDALSLCPGKQRFMDTWAMVAGRDRCTFVAAGLEELLPYCPLTNGDAALSIAQVLFEPDTPNQTTHFVLRLGAAAPDPGDAATWGAWAPVLAGARLGAEER